MAHSSRTYAARTHAVQSAPSGQHALLVDSGGQSNAPGCGAALISGLDVSLQGAQVNVKTFNGSDFVTFDTSLNNNQYPSQTLCAACEPALLKAIQTAYGGTVYYSSYAVSGSALGTNRLPEFTWYPGWRGQFFDKAIANTKRALMRLRALGFRRFTIFRIWNQGEADAQDQTDKGNYLPNMTLMADAYEAELEPYGDVNVIWIVGEIDQNIFQNNATSRAVSGATNASPIEITSAAAHALTSGQYIAIQNVLGNTAANGNWPVTVTSSTKFTIPVAGNGNYTSGGKFNSIYWKTDIQTAERAFVASRPAGTAFSYVKDSYALQSDGVHQSNAGYKDEGEDIVADIIVPNNLLP